MRRDHMKYLTLIRSVALLHQYQRPVREATHQGKTVRYIEVTKEDIAIANRLAHEVLGRSLDELPPQTRRLLSLVDAMVSVRCLKKGIDRCDDRFTRRNVREWTGWGNTQLKVHLHRLEELEYLLVHAGGRGQSLVYELAYEGGAKPGTPVLAGLLDVEDLETHTYDSNRSGSEVEKSASGRPQVGSRSGGGRAVENGEKPRPDDDLHTPSRDRRENTLLGAEPSASVVPASSSLAAAPQAR
jgi:hypothetical protein